MNIAGQRLRAQACIWRSLRHCRLNSHDTLNCPHPPGKLPRQHIADRDLRPSILQGSAADMAKRAMLALHARLPCEDARLVNMVHDELLLEVRADRVQRVGVVGLGAGGNGGGGVLALLVTLRTFFHHCV